MWHVMVKDLGGKQSQCFILYFGHGIRKKMGRINGSFIFLFFSFFFHTTHPQTLKKHSCSSLSLLSPPPRSSISSTKSHLPTIIFYHFNLMVFLIL
ncbi:hypothetical protein HanHA89_Chr15g0628391 [Helianthus annuus]|nr:hypothetical protein HanHA89_Chr15g0628391 [Helianthus annuus]